MTNFQSARKSIYTIGHSNHLIGRFIQLLQKYNIEVLVDIRSNPYSKHSPQFNSRNIREEIITSGIKYLYLGKELGGKPKGKDFYDSKGNIIYSHLGESQIFRKGLCRLEKGLDKYKIAIMCSEEDPNKCHRSLLVGRALVANGIILKHIRGNGELEIQNQFEIKNGKDGSLSENNQLSLFER